MAKVVTVRIRGEKDVIRQLKRLEDSVRKEVIKAELEEAAEVIVADAKRRAPSPTVADGIQVLNTEVESSGTVTTEVGLPGGRRPWFYGLFIERGTGPRVQKKTGRRTGSMPARPFLRPAFDAQKSNVVARFNAGLKRRLARIASRG